MKKTLLIVLSLFALCSCSNQPQKTDLDRAKEAVTNYCNHAYTDYQPNEFLALHAEPFTKDKKIRQAIDSMAHYAYFIHERREVKKRMKELYPDSSSFPNAETEQSFKQIDSLYSADIASAQKRWSAFAEVMSEGKKNFKPSFYVIGHSFIHKAIAELRRLEFGYFVLNKDFDVIGFEENNPIKHENIDFGPTI